MHQIVMIADNYGSIHPKYNQKNSRIRKGQKRIQTMLHHCAYVHLTVLKFRKYSLQNHTFMSVNLWRDNLAEFIIRVIRSLFPL